MPLIDIETIVFSKVANELRSKYVDSEGNPDIFVSGEYIDVPARFPAVTIVESSNTVLRKMTTKVIENATSVMYEVNIYSNLVGYKKSEAKEILETVDDVFSGLGFTRTMANPVANLQDATIYRITARYEGVVKPEYGVDEISYRIYTN